MGIDLPLLWAIIIVFGVMMYVVMDGFDLGIGLLYPFFPDKTDRDVMMNTVAPVWDGNETWLVLGGAGLLAAFPLAYSVVLSAFYLPLIFMLLGLIFRGVAFEFRFKASDAARPLWDKAFIGGSLVATFFQGVTLGAYIDGVQVVNRAYAGGSLDWLKPFSLFTGLGVLSAYALLGCTWLILKTERRPAEAHDRDRPAADASPARGDRRHQHLDAADASRDLGALVHVPQHYSGSRRSRCWSRSRPGSSSCGCAASRTAGRSC